MPAVSYQRFSQEVEEIYALKQPATALMMRQALREVGELGIRKTNELRPVIVARWIKAHPDRAPATMDKLIRSFKAACTVGIASGYLKTSPFAFHIDVPEFDPTQEGKRRHHSIKELSDVLGLARDEAKSGLWKHCRMEAMAHTFAYDAFRRDEGLYLQLPDVDLKRQAIKIEGHKRLKTASSKATVPIPPPLIPILERWLPRCRSRWVFPGIKHLGPWTGGPPGYKPLDELRKLGERAGVEGLTFLSFRHSFATHAPIWGIPAEMVQRILRHSTIRTKKHYEHEDIDDLVAAVQRVRY